MNTLQQGSYLGIYTNRIEAALSELADQDILKRIWKLDHTVWASDPTEITNRLGWLTIPETMQSEISDISEFVKDVRDAGYTHSVLLGMGGSSLAPEVFRKTFGVQAGYLDLLVLDSTDPGAVLSIDHQIDLRRALFIVATKSGGTVETLSGFKYFYNRVMEIKDIGEPGEHFIAITDPGSSLVDLAKRYQFRKVFLNDPNIGGRYSALSHFGLVPASLLGIDLKALLAQAQFAAADNSPAASPAASSAAWLGAALGELAKAGRDKMTFLSSPEIASFGDWVEQLIAESTGKNGKGILPVIGEEPGGSDVYAADRVFIHLQFQGHNTDSDLVAKLKSLGHPIIAVQLKDRVELGAQFFMWELATAIAGNRMGIQPFDQPNVEAAKVLAREVVAEYMKSGSLPAVSPILVDGNIAVYTESSIQGQKFSDALMSFLSLAQPGAYIAFQAYVHSTRSTEAALQSLRGKLRNRTKLATTLGYGPRFLHSTGQLHKGDAGKGLFIQITAEDKEDVMIPDEAGKPGASMKFGTLKMSQALGDAKALQNAGRAVIRFHISGDLTAGLERLAEAL